MAVGVITGETDETIRVLHLDDDPDFAELAATFLERESERIEVVTESSPAEALRRIEEGVVDCVVSDYDMATMNGLEFLESVREDDDELPFILFTGKGSEEIASEAISRGVTDYLQKGTNTDRYTVLANRIENAVSKHRAEREVEKRSEWYGRILEHSSDYVMVVDGMGKVKYISPAVERVMGYDPEELIGMDAFETIHPEDLEYAANALAKTIEDADREVTVEFRSETADGSIRWLEARGSNFLDDPLISGVMVNVRDITERKRREQELEERKERLRELTSFLSHDVENQVDIIGGYAELAAQKYDPSGDELDHVKRGTERIEEMITKVRKLAQSEQDISETETVDLGEAVDQCWDRVTGIDSNADVIVTSTLSFEADESRLRTLLENLLLNAITHGGSDVTVRTGALDGRDGFYVADDGPGIPEDERDQVFDADYTTTQEGTGLGLAIVKRVADAHGWAVGVTEGPDGGARFEVTGVETPDG
ncbi:MAG: PAS domain S-box protein [Halobellus sp.]